MSCSPAPASRRPRTGATGRCRQRNDAWHRDASAKLLGADAGRVGKLVATESRQAMSDRWAVAVVDSSSAFGGRRRRHRSHGPLADRRRDVCRGRPTSRVAVATGGRRDGTPVAWTVSQVGSRADAAPGAHQTATAFRRRCPTPARSYLLAGVYGIG